jgi:membrane protein implicated in regulation of membrane protease activity
MCHILFLLPFIAVFLFLILPFGQALVLYSLILFISSVFFWLIWKDMRRPVATGVEGMVGGVGKVIQNGTKSVKVFYKGEIWEAISTEKISVDDLVEVTGLERMKVIVRKQGRSR